jgi:predicted glutamine amidotransferase
MIKRFFFHRIQGNGPGVTVIEGKNFIIFKDPDPAVTPASLGEMTAEGAQ